MPTLFAKFSRAEEMADGALVLTGVITSEDVDCQGERLDYFRSKPLFQSWAARVQGQTAGKSSGPVRWQHNPLKPIGVLRQLSFDDQKREISCTAAIYDDEARKMIERGVFSGFSISGDYVSKEPARDARGEAIRNQRGKVVFSYVADPKEVSIVDMACNPVCTFEVKKCGGTTAVWRHVGQKKAEACACAATKAAGDEEGIEVSDDVIEFDQDYWDEEEAREWLIDNGYSSGQMEERSGYLIFPQKAAKAAAQPVVREGKARMREPKNSYPPYQRGTRTAESQREVSMNRSDHQKMAKACKAAAGHFGGLAKSFANRKSAAEAFQGLSVAFNGMGAHHESMAAGGSFGESAADAANSGIRNPQGYGDVAPTFTNAHNGGDMTKAFSFSSFDDDQSGGLRKNI